MKLQGKGKLIPNVFSDTENFQWKLINKHVEEQNLAHFSSCKRFSETYGEKMLPWPKKKYSETIQMLQNEFSSKFNRFHSHSRKIIPFQTPFRENIDVKLQIDVTKL